MAYPARHTELSPDCRFTYASQGPTLTEFHARRDAFVRILIGPLGSAKTNACIFEVIHSIDNQTPDKDNCRRSRWVVVRNTYVDLTTTTIKDWRALTDDVPGGNFTNGDPPTWRCDYDRPDGSRVIGEVMFIAFDIEAHEKKARGLQLTGVFFDELKELRKNNFDMLLGRLTRYPPKAEVPGAKFSALGSTNAPDRDHWLARFALGITPEGWWFGIQPGGLIRTKTGKYLRNPKAENIHNLADTYYTRLAASTKDAWIRSNLCNEFVYVSSGMPVHPDFSESVHVAECEPTPGLPLAVGVDFGRTPAAVVMQKQYDGRWQLYRELVTVNTSALSFGRLLFAFMNEHYPHYTVAFTGDPSGGDQSQTRDETPFDMLLIGGITAVAAPTNDFEVRTAALDSLLTTMSGGQPMFTVHPRASTVVRGLAGAYQFKRVQVAGDDRYKNEPDKGPESHACEAVHYGLLGAGAGVALFDGVSDGAELSELTLDPSRFE